MTYLLKLSTRDILFLLFGLPVIVGLISWGLAIVFNSLQFLFIMTGAMLIILFGILLSWFWAVGIAFNERVNPDIKIKSTLFKTILIYAFCTISAGIVSMSSDYQRAYSQIALSDVADEPMLLAVYTFSPVTWFLWFLCLFAMFGFVYVDYFIAKNVIMVEKQQKVKFRDFARLFFSMMILTDAIQLIQPKANELVEE